MSARILNQIGFHNTAKLEQLVQPQVLLFLNSLRKLTRNNANEEGVLWCPKRKLNPFALSVMWTLLFGSKVPQDVAALDKFVSYIDNCNRKFKNGGSRMGFISKLFGPFARLYAWYENSQDFYKTVKVGNNTV